MDSGKLVNWLQIVANLGVVVGLGLVGVQIHQNSVLTSAALLTAATQQDTDHWNQVMGENASDVLAKAQLRPAELTPGELEVLRANVFWWMSMLHQKALSEQAGLFDSSWRRLLLPVAANEIARDPVSRAMFLEAKPVFDWQQELMGMVSAIPAESGRMFLQHQIETARQEAK